ncbi:MAG: Do family serine endopeptidase [Calditrichaeota bacterium]|nr:MAG: Do family serine endopeptidase [Calditrichota bacterium]
MHSRRLKWIFSIFFLALGLALGLLLAGGISLTTLTKGGEKHQKHPDASARVKTLAAPGYLELERLSHALTQIAEKAIPTVVSIHSTKVLTADEAAALSFQQENRSGQRKTPRKFSVPRLYRQKGTGSGVIISPDGYIITNYHVVNRSNEIKVTLADNRSFDAKIIGLDRLSEVAVIKIDGRDLPYARLGNSDSCKIGQLVLAIGNPLDLKSTVTAGIISAKGRQIDIINDNFAVEAFIQTDAAINPGNSGGALVNLRGEVIGINTAIATETGYDMGFGFAIPINLVKKISADLIKNGRVVRSYLGIAMQNIEELQARALGLDSPRGVFVDDVFKNSPAEKADIRPMDIILDIDGQPVNRTNLLQAWVAKKSPGTRVTLRILRDGKIIHRKVVLGARQDQPSNRAAAYKLGRKFKNLGLRVQNLTEFDIIELGYPGSEGVLISDIQRYSPADKTGLQVDDIIVQINKHPIRSTNEFLAEMQKLKSGEVVIIKVFRASGMFHYFIEVP